ncbi:unnamed protein product, partial [Musa acuminata subsp. burmannicoides]
TFELFGLRHFGAISSTVPLRLQTWILFDSESSTEYASFAVYTRALPTLTWLPQAEESWRLT